MIKIFSGPQLQHASVVFVSLAFCSAWGANAAELGGSTKWAVARFPGGAEFGLEIAADDATRARGYMEREHVGPQEGMLFLFERDAPHGMWMKHCRVALDMIWLDKDFRVVDIAYDRQPCPERGACPSILPLRAARYVLEVAAGTARREGLQRGDRVVILTGSGS
jgi:uncharacterized membrane protein (UPF0127 family)